MSQGEDDVPGASIGWIRAVLTAVTVLVVGLAASVGVANLILTKATSLSRSVREDVASVVFLAAVVLLAWALRRLQAHRLI
jgi:fumarate reductase subunit D